ncbi:MAG: polysaccharide deacetylase family protein [Clostridia bacterium]
MKRSNLLLIGLLTVSILLAISVYVITSRDNKSNNDLIDSYIKDTNYLNMIKSPYVDKQGNLIQKNANIPFNNYNKSLINNNIFTNTGVVKNLPILEYHCIEESNLCINPLFVSKGDFERQISDLKNEGYTPITIADFDNIKNIKKPIMITFDDGYENNYTKAYPILKKYNFKATIFLISGRVGTPNHLNIDQINIMKGLIDFQAHTVTHPHLAQISAQQVEDELKNAKIQLETLLNTSISAMAYPYGNFDQQVIDVARKYYQYAFAGDQGIIYNSKDTDYEIKRIFIFPTIDIARILSLFN